MRLCVENPCIYMDISVKTVCTCDYEEKAHVQEEKEIKKEGKQTS